MYLITKKAAGLNVFCYTVFPAHGGPGGYNAGGGGGDATDGYNDDGSGGGGGGGHFSGGGEVVLPIRVAHVVTVVLEELHQLV